MYIYVKINLAILNYKPNIIIGNSFQLLNAENSFISDEL